MSYTISGFLNFHVSHLNHETFKLCLQNTLNVSKTIRVYFGVLHNGLHTSPPEAWRPTKPKRALMVIYENDE